MMLSIQELLAQQRQAVHPHMDPDSRHPTLRPEDVLYAAVVSLKHVRMFRPRLIPKPTSR